MHVDKYPQAHTSIVMVFINYVWRINIAKLLVKVLYIDL